MQLSDGPRSKARFVFDRTHELQAVSAYDDRRMASTAETSVTKRASKDRVPRSRRDRCKNSASSFADAEGGTLCLLDDALDVSKPKRRPLRFTRRPSTMTVSTSSGQADCTTAISIFASGAILMSLVRFRRDPRDRCCQIGSKFE